MAKAAAKSGGRERGADMRERSSKFRGWGREAATQGLAFVAIADGRVSRLHCTIRAEMAQAVQGHGGEAGQPATPQGRLLRPLTARLSAWPQAVLRDFSSNGTFVNGIPLPFHPTGPLYCPPPSHPLQSEFFKTRADN